MAQIFTLTSRQHWRGSNQVWVKILTSYVCSNQVKANRVTSQQQLQSTIGMQTPSRKITSKN